MVATADCVSAMRAALGRCHCLRAATTAITAKGRPPKAPTARYSAGSSATLTRPTAVAIPALIHHGDRSRIANSEFFAISSFTRDLRGSACSRQLAPDGEHLVDQRLGIGEGRARIDEAGADGEAAVDQRRRGH